jgi:spermidine synthase
VLGAALIAAVLAMPDNGQLWQRLHGQSELEIRFNEDETALVAIVPDRDPAYQRVSINGKGHSKLPYGKWNAFQAMLGVVPAAIHPAPNDVAIVGLGSGESAWGASFRQVTRDVTVYEIAAGLAPMLEGVAKDPVLPRMRALFEDPRVRIVTADGRIALATGNKLYDLIETDPLRPSSAYSGNLYSVEFYKLASQKLKPGGLMMVWAPTENIRQAFRAAFSHVVQFDDLGPALLGSNQPIDLNVAEALQRLRSPRALRYLGADIAAGTERVLSNSRDEPWEADAGELPNEDLFPRDEFQTPPGT